MPTPTPTHHHHHHPLRRFLFRRWLVILLTFAIIINLYLSSRISHILINVLRPLYQRDPAVWLHPGVSVSTNWGYRNTSHCSRFSWNAQDGSVYRAYPREGKVKVFDTFVLGQDLDMLELRLAELYPVVDYFVFFESAVRWATNAEKPLFYLEHKDRFAKWHDKIVNLSYDMSKTREKISDYGKCTRRCVESNSRLALMEALVSLGIQPGDVILHGDVDEIPRRSIVSMLKDCSGYPPWMGLLLDNFRYSYEFILERQHPGINVHFFGSPAYPFGKEICKHCARNMDDNGAMYWISDAGWHCSFCFKSIEEYQWKMFSWNHDDRALENPDSSQAQMIQERICSGLQLFGMLPEAWTFADLIAWTRPYRRRNTIEGLPLPIQEEPEKYEWLLPGGCERQLKRD